MNVQAAELHIHATPDHVDDAHHQGPASHRHDVSDHHASDTTQVAGLEADDTVIHVSFAAASAHSIKLLHAAREDAPLFEADITSTVVGAHIVPRAHGPPLTVQNSLRAPPSLPAL